MAVAAGGQGELPLPVCHREAGRPQGKRAAQPGAGKGRAADFHLRHIARVVPLGRAEPPGGFPLGRQPQRLQHRGHLGQAVSHGNLVIRHVGVPGGLYPLQVGQGGQPDVLAGLGMSGADAVVAGRGRRAVIAQQRIGHLPGQFLQPRVPAGKIFAPAGAQYVGARPACAQGAVHLERLFPQRKRIAVAGYHLGADRIVGPVRRQFAGRRTGQELRHRNRDLLPGGRVIQRQRFPGVGGAGRRRGGQRPGRGQGNGVLRRGGGGFRQGPGRREQQSGERGRGCQYAQGQNAPQGLFHMPHLRPCNLAGAAVQ